MTESLPEFEFKHGHRIQFHFNQERCSKLSELETLVEESDFQKAVELIKEEKAALLHRDKILKISDRHGWYTVHEYLDDPLADDTKRGTRRMFLLSPNRTHGQRLSVHQRTGKFILDNDSEKSEQLHELW